MYNVNDIRCLLTEKYQLNDFVVDKTGVKTVELIGTSFVADEPVIFGEVNYEWCERELAWYYSRSLNVNDIPPPIPAIWKQVATPEGEINSNYGWCILSTDNGNQYLNVIKHLRENKDSRRATMIYNRPSMHTDYNSGGKSDFMCTNAVNYCIRDNQLHAVVQMRSNDAIFGYKGDYFWQKHVLDTLAEKLEVSPGNIIWNSASLHVYERHFPMLESFLSTGKINK